VSTETWSEGYLAVDGKPFPVVGAEVHNSSSSSIPAIDTSFATVHALGANTVLAPVAWDLLEPSEGVFDFSLVDHMIATARARNLRLIPLWFGSWKNAVSTYVPAWVKTDAVRFPRSELSDGSRVEHLTPFCSAARDADARAFAALMRRIREVDTDNTVIAVQVENEIGLLGDARDRSTHAESAFAAEVPAGVIEAIAGDESAPLHAEWLAAGGRREGTWAEVFPVGDRSDEAFMAAAFASYTEAVASAGAAEYDLPLFVNAWLDADSVFDGPVTVAGGKRPGQYPSGGPVMPVAVIWEALAPSLHFLAVDAYVKDAGPVFAAFRSRRDRLFVPELRADAEGVAQMFAAVGAHRAVGVSLFGVDAYTADDADFHVVKDGYALLAAAATLIRNNPGARTYGFELSEDNPATTLTFDRLTIQVHSRDEHGMVTPSYPGYGIAVEDGDGAYIIGRGFWITLVPQDGRKVSFLSATHYDHADGVLTVARHLNGDETGGGTFIPFPLPGSPLLPFHAIPMRIPEAAMTRVSVYTY
jgi:hypothetical protein